MKDSISKFASIILAGGLSSRMMEFKPLMPLGKITIIEHVILLYQSVGIHNIYVVTGHRTSEIDAKIKKYDIKIIYNPKYKHEMFSSILTGIYHLCDSTKYFFVHPVDIPLVRSHTITTLMNVATKKKISIIYPYFDGKRGHPPLISVSLKKKIKKWTFPGGLRQCLESSKKRSINIPVADQGILANVNTPESYKKLLHKFYERNILAPKECTFLMKQITQTPDKIIRHCQTVAKIAVSLAITINKTNKLHLNTKLIKSSALIHDMFRNQKNHAQAGGKLLKQLGYEEMSTIVEQHMNISVHKRLPITESEIVYLADKLVDGNIPVNLETKLKCKKKIYGKNLKIINIINNRIKNASKIKNKIESITSTSIENIIEKTTLGKEK